MVRRPRAVSNHEAVPTVRHLNRSWFETPLRGSPP